MQCVQTSGKSYQYSARVLVERMVVRSHLPPFKNLSHSIHFMLPLSFNRDPVSGWSILSIIYDS